MAIAPVAYDASIIQKFAGRLYKQAASIIITSTIMWGLGTAVLLSAVTSSMLHGKVEMVAIAGAVVGGLFGFVRGRERAFHLKLEAQVALCQVQIEKNTRGEHN